MAELHQISDDPITLSEKINDEEDNTPNVIDDIYKSMSKVVEALNADNIILNKQITSVKAELEFICNALAIFKAEVQETSSIYHHNLYKMSNQLSSINFEELNNVRKKIEIITDLQKYTVNTRNILLQTLDINLKSIKKELNEIKQTKDLSIFRNNIKNIIEEEIKIYIDKLSRSDKKFEILEKEQKNAL